MAETVIRVLKNGSIEYVPWPENYEQVETGDVHFDIAKLTQNTGWRPAISLEEGIERMHSYYAPRLSCYF